MFYIYICVENEKFLQQILGTVTISSLSEWLRKKFIYRDRLLLTVARCKSFSITWKCTY